MADELKVEDSRCRLGQDVYVHYTVREEMDELESFMGRSLTHSFVTNPDDLGEDESEFDWMIEVPTEPGESAIVRAFENNDPATFELCHSLPEATLRQLADMFLTAAIRMRERDAKEEFEARAAAAKVQPLPFV
jgi:hypothetical protein